MARHGVNVFGKEVAAFLFGPRQNYRVVATKREIRRVSDPYGIDRQTALSVVPHDRQPE
jgi:hypothetical protein